MSLKKTLVLAVLLTAALLYVYKVEIPSEERKEKEEQPFAYVAKDSIKRIEIVNAGQGYILAKTGDDSATQTTEKKAGELPNKEVGSQWRIDSVEGSELESGPLTLLLTSLESLKTGSAIPAEEVASDLTVYGLKEPEVSMTVDGAQKETNAPVRVQLRFGKKNEYLGQRYLQVIKENASATDKPLIFLIPEALFTAAHKSSLDFRRKNLINFMDAQVQKVTLQNGPEQVVLEANNTQAASPLMPARWNITGLQNNLSAADDSVAEVLRNVRNIKAKDFVDGEAAKSLEAFGLDSKTKTMQIDFIASAQKAPLVITFGQTGADSGAQKYYLSISGVPSVLELEADPSDKIFKSVSDVRQKQFFRFMTDQVSQIEIARAERDQFSIAKESEDSWKVVAANGTTQSGDAVFIRQLLSNLSGLKAQGFPSESGDLGFASPQGTVILSFAQPAQAASEKSTEPEVKAAKLTLLIGATLGAGESANEHAAVVRDVDGKDLSPTFVISSEDFDKITPRMEVVVPAATPTPEATQQVAKPANP